MIEISKGPTKYTATVHVRRDLGATNGSATEGGPWVCGVGASPEDALSDLYREIGRHYVLTLEGSAS